MLMGIVENVDIDIPFLCIWEGIGHLETMPCGYCKSG